MAGNTNLENKPEEQPLQVTCAVILEQGRVLVTQRSEHMPLPLLWEFPGGKLHPDETEQECLVREIREELSVLVEPLQRLRPVLHHTGTRTICLIPYLCRLLKGELRLAEHKQYLWVQPHELAAFAWCPADVPVVEEVMELLQQKG